MEFRILGPVEVSAGDRLLQIPRQERCLLGILLLAANRPVPVDRLAELLWEEDQPKRVRGTIQGYVSRLRTVLAGSDIELVYAGDGYRIFVDPETVDAHRFRSLRERAAGTADLQGRLALLRAALDLWRGPALADSVGGSARERLCAELAEQRLATVEDLATVSLALRREREILPELSRTAGEHPGRESLVALHIRALYQADRRVEALEAYHRARSYLADELGIDPGPDLRQLHQAVLRDELDPPPPVAAGHDPAPPVAAGHDPAPPGPVIPRQLPADVTSFTGRAAHLEQLDTLLPGEGSLATVLTSAIGGTAGVGKTALAVHWAHRVAERFPDGQLFIDLHGFTNSIPAVEPGDALDRMLRALGVPGSRIPAELDDRAALWRSVLAGKQMLIALDNAATGAQVAPLLPGEPGCLVLVTSRRRLAGLDAAQTVSLDMLPLAEALTLFTRVAGASRLAGEPRERIVEAVELCGNLPLAIRIAAARLRSRPAWRVTDLVERLRDQDQRLAELVDGTRGVAAALDVSYRQLAPEHQRMYRLLGLHPGPELEPYAAAALAGSGVAPARRWLDNLLDAHLLQERIAGRFILHDLVRAHAAATAAEYEPAADRRAARERLLHHYRHVASLAADVLYPYERDRRPAIPPAATPAPEVADPARAAGWLDAELPNLLAAAEHAAGEGRPGDGRPGGGADGDRWPEHAWHLSATLHRHLFSAGRYQEAESLHGHALACTRAAGNRAGEIDALLALAVIYRQRGAYQTATDHYRLALGISRTAGHRTGEVDARNGLGSVQWIQGRHPRSVEDFERAYEIARTTGDSNGELVALLGLGLVHFVQGHTSRALGEFQRVEELAEASGHHPGLLTVWNSLGNVYQARGRYEEALVHFGRARDLAHSIGNQTSELAALIGVATVQWLLRQHSHAFASFQRVLRTAEAIGHHLGRLNALHGLGGIYLDWRMYEQAADCYRQVLATATEMGNLNWQFEARQGMGRLQLAIDRPLASLAHHREALDLAVRLGQVTDQARAHDGLASAHHAVGQPAQARVHWQAALDILAGLGIENTEDHQTTVPAIRAKLDRL